MSSEIQEATGGKWNSTALDWGLTIGVAIALAVLLRIFVGESYIVPSGSMLDTIQLGDRIWGEKVSYRFREPEPGEIVTFDNPSGDSTILVKRVIAVGGQTVDLVDGKVVVDGVELNEPYVQGKRSDPILKNMPGIDPITYPLTVPQGCVWVMGDNRTNSADSRYFGPVDTSRIAAHALFTYWPIEDIRTL